MARQSRTGSDDWFLWIRQPLIPSRNFTALLAANSLVAMDLLIRMIFTHPSTNGVTKRQLNRKKKRKQSFCCNNHLLLLILILKFYTYKATRDYYMYRFMVEKHWEVCRSLLQCNSGRLENLVLLSRKYRTLKHLFYSDAIMVVTKKTSTPGF